MKNFKIIIALVVISTSFDIFAQQGWVQLNSGTNNNLLSVCFTDANTGYTSGINGTVIKTTNGGLNWAGQQTGTGDELHSIDFVGQTGYVVGGANALVILKTTNGGMNWVSQTVTGVSALHTVFMIDSVMVYAAGHNGKIIKTTNGGINWSVYTTDMVDHFNSIFFVNINTGYAGATFHHHLGGVVYRTTNGGVNWIFAEGETAYSVFFVNSQTGYKASSNGIAKTTNSGVNWTYQSLGGSLASIWFTNLLTGYAAGYRYPGSGRIFTTNNGELNWSIQTIPTARRLNSIIFTDINTGYAVGDTGTILKTTNGGITGLEPVNNEIPKEYKLYQNYPNPFNPTTKIKFEIKNNAAVQLVIFDILGRKAETLVNDELKQGTYEIDFEGSQYASGIYYYKLISEAYTEVKKMILIK